jgi:predicted ATP-dependent endonuclease of OLD family
MRLAQLSATNYKVLRDVTIPLSRFGCLIGENNSGKSSFLQALSLFFSGSRLSASHFFDETKPIRIAVTFENIGEADLARLVDEHRRRVAGIVKNGRIVLVRTYSTDGKSALLYNTLKPTDARFSEDRIATLMKRQRPSQTFVDKVIQTFPELDGKVDATMNQADMKQKIQELADSLPDDQKTATDQALPTGIDKSIEPMLPDRIYIPAVKDLADDVKTTESTPFGRILSILLRAVEQQLPDAQKLFEELDSKLNRVHRPDGTVVDKRLDEVKLIESTIEKYVQESFADVALHVAIPPPELKTIFSSARIYANDGVDGLIESKGDGLRRAIVFSILRSYVELNEKLATAPAEDALQIAEAAQQNVKPAPASYLLLFEEPELFLHPKAQYVLFDALRVFAKEHHVLVTTHSPMFFGPGATETFIKLRRVSDMEVAAKPFTQVQPVDLSDMKSKDQFQIICFENNNAAFFADTVILVEGDSDYLVMPHIARTIDPSWDVAQAPVLFARITGKGNIRRYREFFTRFGARVPVIADLDLLVNGFDHIAPDDALKTARGNLLAKADKLIVPDDNEEAPSTKEAKGAHDSGELRGLWRRVKHCQTEFKAGTCTQDELDQALETFFAWQNKSDRLAVLQNSTDGEMLQLKWRLLDMLRDVDVYVLERGAIEQYYPATITGADKPSRAQEFCAKVDTRDAILACCGEQEVERNGVRVRKKEFNLIFGSIFGE